MRSPIVRLALAGMLAAACGGRSEQQAADLWLVPEEQFFGTVNTIGVVPLAVPDYLENPAPVQAMFDSLIAQQLRQAGYAVVWVAEGRDVAAEENEEHVTGAPEDALVRTRVAHTVKRLAAAHPGVDAFLEPTLVVVEAAPAFDGEYYARWHGVTETIPPEMGASLLGHRLSAFSLCVGVWSLEGVAMFHNDGGIQLAALGAEPVARSKLFTDRERNLDAVRIALRPVVQYRAPKPVT